jgi:hypothetical protein
VRLIRGFFLFLTIGIFAPIVGGIALLNIALRPTKWPKKKPDEIDPIGDDPGKDVDA